MATFDTSDLIPVLQTAIGPVVMVSGVGLLLLTMTNRLGRVVDRARALAQQLKEHPDDHPTATAVKAQLHILSQRARLIRSAIAFASFCVLFAGILVIALFVAALFKFDIAWFIAVLFICSVGCLIFSLVQFIRDVNKSLVAIKLEVGREWTE